MGPRSSAARRRRGAYDGRSRTRAPLPAGWRGSLSLSRMRRGGPCCLCRSQAQSQKEVMPALKCGFELFSRLLDVQGRGLFVAPNSCAAPLIALIQPAFTCKQEVVVQRMCT